MKKLTINELAPYLPYKLWVFDEVLKEQQQLTGILYDGLVQLGHGGRFGFNQKSYSQIKPILHPLSDLTIDWYWNNLIEGNVMLDEKDIEAIKNTPRGQIKFIHALYLFMHHFDFWGLIEKGLAIDINTLNK